MNFYWVLQHQIQQGINYLNSNNPPRIIYSDRECRMCEWVGPREGCVCGY